MNCECIYYNRNASKEDYAQLAEKISRMGKSVEIYPCAVSRMDERTKCCEDYAGWGDTMNIPKWSVVLFVGGKYCYMNPIKVGRRTFRPWFPIDYPYFTDLHTFDD